MRQRQMQALSRQALRSSLASHPPVQVDAQFAQQYVPGRMPNDTSKIAKAVRKKAAKERRREAARYAVVADCVFYNRDAGCVLHRGRVR